MAHFLVHITTTSVFLLCFQKHNDNMRFLECVSDNLLYLMTKLLAGECVACGISAGVVDAADYGLGSEHYITTVLWLVSLSYYQTVCPSKILFTFTYVIKIILRTCIGAVFKNYTCAHICAFYNYIRIVVDAACYAHT